MRRATNSETQADPAKSISIHALLAESDLKTPCVKLSIDVFLSTLSLRRATGSARGISSCTADFYPRSPCGERLSARREPRESIGFLSTLSLRRATITSIALSTQPTRFLSTLSLRRATSADCNCHNVRPDFYPRSPCGERLVDTLILTGSMLFLSTLSLRRATIPRGRHISETRNFYPRSPCGERLPSF